MVYYLTYDEYSEMGGTLDETLFNTLVLDAQAYIDWYTSIVSGRRSGAKKM